MSVKCAHVLKLMRICNESDLSNRKTTVYLTITYYLLKVVLWDKNQKSQTKKCTKGKQIFKVRNKYSVLIDNFISESAYS